MIKPLLGHHLGIPGHKLPDNLLDAALPPLAPVRHGRRPQVLALEDDLEHRRQRDRRHRRPEAAVRAVAQVDVLVERVCEADFVRVDFVTGGVRGPDGRVAGGGAQVHHDFVAGVEVESAERGDGVEGVG